MLGLAYRDVIPWWLVVVLLAREAFIAGLLPLLKSRGYTALPVHFLGKAATFCLLYAFPLLLLGEFDNVAGDGRPADRLGLHLVGHRAVLGGRRCCTPCRPAHIVRSGARPPVGPSMSPARR